MFPSHDRAGAGAIVNRFINIGRNNFALDNGDEIQGFQFSAIIDSKTTPICRSLDGQTFKVGEVKALDLRPPLHWNCRSILLPILFKDGDIKFTGLKVKPVEVNGKVITKKEVLQSKQFEETNHRIVDYNALEVGSKIERNGKTYIKDYDGKFRLA